LQSVDVETFLARSGELDAAMAERVAAAVADGNALKYVATVAAGGPVAVGPRPVSTGGVLGALRGPDNVIAIRSRRYDDYPLTIVGPGAGADVTAAGMIGDALALALGPLVGSIRGGTV
jgi:homoserine dehydrogenase